MNGVEFDSERQATLQQMQRMQESNASSSKFANWLINKGIVKTEVGAQRLQIVLVVINIVVTVWVIKTFVQ